MLRTEECVDHHDLGTAEAFDCAGRNGLGVGDIRERADAIGEDGHWAMWYRHRNDVDVSDRERNVRLDDMSAAFRLRRTGDWATVIEDVRELSTQTLERFGGAEHRQGCVAPNRERAKVVDAMRVVGVIVREQHRVDAIDPGSDQLQPQLGGCVDEYSRTTIRLDERADTCSFVARIGGATHFASAAEHGNTEAGAGAEEEEAHF